MFCLDPSKRYGNGIPPNLLKDKRYSLINWIMTLYKEDGHHIILKLFYNRKHKWGHFVVKNAFDISKENF